MSTPVPNQQWTYDAATRTLWIRLSEQPCAYTRDASPEHRIAYAADDTPVIVECLDVDEATASECRQQVTRLMGQEVLTADWALRLPDIVEGYTQALAGEGRSWSEIQREMGRQAPT